MRGLFTILILLLVSSDTIAQDYALGDKRVLLRSVTFQAGFYHDIYDGSLDDFRAIAPESDLLNQDFADFNLQTGQRRSNSSAYSILFGFDLLNPDKKSYRTNLQLKAGLDYYRTTVMENSFFERNIFTTDTTYGNGTTVFINEEHWNSGRFTLESHQIRLHGRLLMRTNQRIKLSAYGGIGLSLGHSFQTEVEIYTVDRSSREFRNIDGTVLGLDVDSPPIDLEEHDSKGHFASSVGIPIGLSYKLSNRSEFLSRVKVFYEVSPEIRWTSIPEIGTISQNSFHFAGGIEFKI